MTTKPSHALLIACLAALVAACGSTPAPGGEATPVGTSPSATPSPASSGGGTATSDLIAQAPVTAGEVTLEARMGIGFAQYPDDPGIRRAPGLVVEYTLRNRGAADLLVRDRVPKELGSATLPEKLDPEHAWVHPQAGVVRVTKQGFGAAPGVAFVAAPVIGARRLVAGGQLTGRAVVPVPLETDVPDENFAAPRAAVDPGATQWQFCVQVEPGDGMPAPGQEEGVLVTPASAPGAQGLVCTAPTRLVLP